MAREWVRPYPPSKGRLVVAAWEFGALAFFQKATVDLYHLDRLSTALWVAIFVLWVAFCWRLAAMGVYTSHHGVLIRGLLTRRTMSWHSIRRITVDDATFKIGRLAVPSGRTVWFETPDGARVNSTLYAEGIDFKFRRHLFKRTHEDLRHRHSLETGGLHLTHA